MGVSVILTGPMGSGKTSIGQLLSAQLGYEFIDLDALIVEKVGKSINQLFADEGEISFRDHESAVLSALVGRQNIVLSTGGGVVVREQNRQQLHTLGLVVNLTASVKELAKRLLKVTDRPLLTGDEPLEARIERIMIDREQFYADADIRIDTTGKTLEDVAAIILSFCMKRRLRTR
jgi:shikimate kinase